MKKILIIQLIILGGYLNGMSQADAISSLFNQYMDDERFTSIYISGKMFSMFAKIPEDEEKDLKEVISNLNGLRILSSDSVDGERMYKDATKNLSMKGYEELMFIKEGGQQELQFLVKEADGRINELLLLSGRANNFFLMSLIGNIDLSKISKLSKSMDIEGMEQLEKLKEKDGH
ncbi:MAG: DUF4252 domain-containing protein [Candidatus Cyclobacteriaceae bacterium M3_2C_046]